MKPFHAIRVLDLTHVLAGPFCTYQLATLGADVLKIESPTGPDMMRGAGPNHDYAEQKMGIHFLSQSAGKRAITLNLKTEKGRDILRQLVSSADVLVENYRGGVMDALKLGYADLSPVNPGLIYCSITGFGHTGPKARHAAYDNVIQAYSGLMDATGSVESGPVKIGPPVLDYGTGAQAALAISAALFQRTESGKGQHIDVAMLDAAMMLMSSSVVETLDSGSSPMRSGNSSGVNAGYGCYATSDGMLMVGAYTCLQHVRMWTALDQPELAAHARTMTVKQMQAQVSADASVLTDIFVQRSADYWEELLNDAGIPAARVRTLKESLSTAQIKSRRVTNDVRHPLVPGDSLSVTVAAFDYHKDGPTSEQSPPGYGQHTAEVLQELGFGTQEIDQLIDSGVV